jgi:hypothetical protein
MTARGRKTIRLLFAAVFLIVPAAFSAEFESYVPIRQITSDSPPHWFGYYDKLQFDSTDRYVLGMRPPFEGKTPGPDDIVELGVIDLKNENRWSKIGETRAWNWQQGCMLQWIPGTNDIIYNDRRGGKFVSVVTDQSGNEKRVLPHAIYTLAPDGNRAATLNFSRLAYTRPGYGYTGIPYSKLDANMPDDEGVYVMDLETGKRKLVYSLKQIGTLHFQEGMDRGLNWVNHLLFNTDGTRLIFLHRWRSTPYLKSPWSTRMFTVGSDGQDLHLVADHGMVSHFIWKNSADILAWSREPDTGNRFHYYEDRSDTVSVVGEGVLNRDGHCTYSPDGQWILTDTYPDKDRMQNLMLYRPADGKLIPLGKFKLDRGKKGELRCDLHPRWNNSGTQICIDSMHSGSRQMYLLDIAEIMRKNQ